MPTIYLRIIRLFGLLPALLTLSGCLQWRYSDKEWASILNERDIPVAIHHVRTRGADLRYLEIRRPEQPGRPPRPNMLLIHGAPSSNRVWTAYLTDTTLSAACNLYAPDRPGYGYSDFGRPDTSIEHQVEVLEEILRRHPGPWIVHGSSYGGPIAAVLAARNPDKVKGILFTSPALAPGQERIYGVSYWIRLNAFGWFFPAIFRVANAEKLSHQNALTRILPYYAQITQPTTYLYGGQDDLIYNSNARFADSAFTHTRIKFIKLENRPHFFTYSEIGLIEREMMTLLNLTHPPRTEAEAEVHQEAADSSRMIRQFLPKPAQ